jgi:mannose-6-phosphate isomerase-like protein (cupin superfamily)
LLRRKNEAQSRSRNAAKTYAGGTVPDEPWVGIAELEPPTNALAFRKMIVSDLSQIPGRRYPARRLTQNLAGGAAPIQATHFSMGNVILEPRGGQVPWHNQEQEEVYFVIEGTGEMCLGEERQTISGGQMVYIPPGVFHQLTNIGETPLRMIYCYGPAGDVAHWRQELAGTLPRAGIEAPPLPSGAQPQCTAKPGD